MTDQGAPIASASAGLEAFAGIDQRALDAIPTGFCVCRAALSAPYGRIDLTCSHETGGRVALCWTESGGPPSQPPTRRGFGTRVIEQMIAQLKGKTNFDWRPEGLVCNIELRGVEEIQRSGSRANKSSGPCLPEAAAIFSNVSLAESAP